TLNLGVLGNGTAGNTVSANYGAQALVQGSGTVTTTSSLGADGTLGSSVVYKSGAGAYTWAGGTTNGSGTLTIGTYTGDTAHTLPFTGGTDPGTNYIMSLGGSLTSAETVNLLHMTGGTLNGSTTHTLTVNGGGILITGTTASNFGSASVLSGAPA